MKKESSFFIACLFLLLTESFSYGQKAVTPERLSDDQWFQMFEYRDGRGGLSVRSIFSDHNGMIWFGKESGLFRFDGISYLSFFSGTADTSIYGPVVLCIHEDTDGFIWAGTYSALNRLDVRTGRIKHFFPDTADMSGGNNSIIYINEDSRGNLWLHTRKNIFCFNRLTEEFRMFPIDSLAWNSEQLNIYHESGRFLEDSLGRIWIATNNGLWCLSGSEWKKTWPVTEDLTGKNDNKVNCVAEDTGGNIWFGTKSHGLRKISPEGFAGDPEFPFVTDPYYDKGISAIYCDVNGKTWVSSNKVLAVYDAGGKLADSWYFAIRPDRQRNFEGNLFINKIFAGKNNDLWLVWVSQGIILNFSLTSGKLKYNGVPNWMDFDCVKDGKGNIWFGTLYSRFYCLVADSVPLRGLAVQHQSGPESWDRSRLAEDFDGRLWMVLRSGLVETIKTPDANSLPIFPLDTFHLPYRDVKPLSVFCDSRGRIWFGCSGNEIISYEPARRQFRRFVPPRVGIYGIEIIAEDRKGNLWFVNPGEAVYILRQGEDGIEKFLTYDKLPGSQGKPNLWDFMIDTDDNLLFSTNYGVYRANPESGAVSDLTPPDGTGKRYFDWFLRLLEDGNGNVWALNSLNGLFRYDRNKDFLVKSDLPEMFSGFYYHNLNIDSDRRLWIFHNNTIRIYDTESGKFRDLFFSKLDYDLNCYRLSSGDMAVLNNSQIIIFPRNIPYNREIPPVYLTKLLVNKIIYHDIFPEEDPVTDLKKIDLGFRQNTLSLHFTSLNYIRPELNRFRYFMKGMDKDTLETISPAAEYINMKPGKYIFWYTGSNNDGIWNAEGKTLDIRIHPPIYRSTLAYIIYFILFASALVIYIRLRTRRLRIEKSRLEDEIGQRTAELEAKNVQLEEADRTKTRFFTNISHEIRTPLSLILGPLEKLTGDNAGGNGNGTVFRVMKRNGQRLMQLVNQLLDISRLDSGKMRIILSETDIFKRLRVLAYEFLSLAETKDIRYMVDIPSAELIALIDIDKTEKILSNLLSNAFKFTQPGGTVWCSIVKPDNKGKAADNNIEIRVRDTGPGISAEHIEKIFDRFYRVEEHPGRNGAGTGIGLSLTREFVDLLHGSIEVRSNPGEGTEFTVILPAGKDHLSEDEYIIISPSTPEPEAPNIHHEALVAHHSEEHAEKEQRVTILVVEDNADLKNYIRENLESAYRVITADDGKEASNLAFTMIPDLVVTDLMMPVLDGTSLCRMLKEDERTSHIPVIMLTARATNEERIAGLMTGADDYIVKPFSINELKVRIANLIGMREKLRHKYMDHLDFRIPEIKSASMDDRFMEKIYSIIRENLRNFDFDAGMLHEKAGMSRVHLFRKLKALTGLSPGTLIRRVRLETGAMYLLKHSGNITEVSNSVGISNPSYFTKCFRKHFGMSPKEYAVSAKSGERPIRSGTT